MRVNHVVTVACFPEHGNLHVFQQADVLAFEVRRLGGLQRKNGAIPIHL